MEREGAIPPPHCRVVGAAIKLHFLDHVHPPAYPISQPSLAPSHTSAAPRYSLCVR